MAAIFTGIGAGLARGSVNQLGAAGTLGIASTGRAGEGLYVNAATGNLVISRQDEFLVGRGPDAIVSRTYNSLAQVSDDNGDHWRFGAQRRLANWTGTANTPGASVQRVNEDGSVVTYLYDAASGNYRATDGTGAHDTLVNVGHWRWIDGDTQAVENYDIDGNLITHVDPDGNLIHYTYHWHNNAWRLSKATTSSGEYQEYVWSGESVSQITTGYTDLAVGNARTQVRTRFAYDGYSRLVQVTVDLSPDDNSAADGYSYVTTYTYDGSSRRIASVSQTDGSRTDIAYDAAGRVTSLTEHVAQGEARVTRIGYGYHVSSVTNAQGQVTKLWYDIKGQLIQLMSPPATTGGAAIVHQFEYDAVGNLLRTIETDAENASVPQNLVTASNWAAGEQALRGDNLVDDSGWPQDRDGTLPASNTIGQGWAIHSIPETEWAKTTGPYGQQVVSLHTGQTDTFESGGGAISPSFTIDKTKAYEFSIYVKADQLDQHRAYLGLAGGNVQIGHTGAVEPNPYFTYEFPHAPNGWTTDRWVKIVGYVLPQGSALEPYTSVGGVYDTVTGQKLYGGFHYVWDAGGGDQSFLRFFNYYSQSNQGMFTHWVRPEVRAVHETAILRGDEKLDVGRDASRFSAPSVEGWNPWAHAFWNDDEARWASVDGPDGGQQVALQTGQFDGYEDGGGNYTNEFTIDGTKAYKFTQYVRKSDLQKHQIYFGLSANWSGPAFVKDANGGVEIGNPYFVGLGTGLQQSVLSEDRWYKVVGYVLPAGSANIVFGQFGGVFDAVTGTKVADVSNYRWSENRPSNSIHARFFSYYDHTLHGWSTDWLAPGVVQLDMADVAADSADPFGIVYDESGKITRYGYDERGNIIFVQRPLEASVTKSYDGANRLVLETTTGSNEQGAAVSQSTRYVYDAEGHLRYRVSADGRVSEYRYHGVGALLYSIEYPEHRYTIGSTILDEATMDAWRDSLADRSSISITQYEINARGNRTQTIEYGSATVAGAAAVGEGYAHHYHTYDHNGRLLTTVTATQARESFVYDGMDRLVASVDGDGGTTSVFFDDANSRTVIRMASGVTRTMVYNKSGDLIAETESAAGSGPVEIPTDLAAWWVSRTNRTATTSLSGAHAHQYTSASTDYYGYTATWNQFAAGEDARFRITVRGDGVTTTHHLGLWGETEGWGANTDGNSQAIIISGPGRLTQHLGGLWRLDGVSSTQETTIEIIRPSNVNQPMGAYFYIGELGITQAGTGVTLSGVSLTKTVADTSLAFSAQTQAKHDRLGRLRVTQDAFDGRGPSFTVYDKAGRRVGAVDPHGGLVEYFYDSASRVIGTATYGNAVSGGILAQLADPNNSLEMDDIRPALQPGYDIHSWTIYDAAGRAAYSVNGEGEVVGFTYDDAGRLVREWHYANRLALSAGWYTSPPTAITPPAASGSDYSVRTFYDRDGHVRGTLDGENYLTEYRYDGAGRKIEEVAYAARVASSLSAAGSFDELRTSAGIADLANRRVRNVYDAQGQLRFIVDGAGRVTEHVYTNTVEYESVGLVRRSISYAATIATTDFSYKNVKALVGAIANPTFDRKTSYTYTAGGRVGSTTDAAGVTTGFVYDRSGRLIKSTVGDRTTRNWYDARGNLRFSVDAEGYLSSYLYNTGGQVTNARRHDAQVSVGDSTTIQQVAAMAASNGYSETISQYDAKGQLYSQYDPVGTRNYYTYWLNGLSRYVDRAYGTAQNANDYTDHSRTVYAYDRAGRLVWEEQTDGIVDLSIAQLSYSSFGNRSAARDGNGHWSSFTYDKRGQVLTQTDALGHTTRFEYNAFGEVVKSWDAKGTLAVRNSYNALGQLVSTTDALDNTTSYTYTQFGEVATVTDARGAVTSFQYDRLGRVVRNTDALGYVETYNYDAYGDRTQTVNKLGGVTQYTYDRLGRLRYEWVDTKAYNSDGAVTADGYDKNIYEYDARGNVVRHIEAYELPEQQTTVFAYDRANRLIEKTGQTFLDMTPITTYAYDGRGNLTRMTDPAGARTIYFYDDLDRVTIEISPVGTLTKYEYDKVGNSTRIRVFATAVPVPADGGAEAEAPAEARNPSGAARDTRFEYDAANRMVKSRVVGVYSGTFNGSVWVGGTSDLETRYEYDANGNVVKTIDPQGNTTWAYYDLMGRKKHQVDGANYRTDWGYDAVGNITSERVFANAVEAPSNVWSIPEVSLDNYNDRRTEYAYDFMGNRLSEQRFYVKTHDGAGGHNSQTHPIVYYSYNALSQVTRKVEATGEGTDYAYDTSGRLITEVRQAFVDFAGSTVSPTVDYYYDALGNLTRSTQRKSQSGNASDRISRYGYDGDKLRWVADAETGDGDNTNGLITYYGYDVAGRQNIVFAQRYDSAGKTTLPVSNGSANHEAIVSSYDLAGRLIQQYQGTYKLDQPPVASGPSTKTSYNAYGDVTSVQIGDGASQQNVYDLAGRLVATNAGDGVWKHFGYDKNGNQTVAITSAGESLAGLTFDQALALVGQADVNATFTRYDARNMAVNITEEGRQLSADTTKDLVTQRSYNAFGEVAYEIDAAAYEIDAADGRIDYTYNTMGKVIMVESPEVSYQQENSNGTLAAVTTGRPTEHFYYDGGGRLVAQRDANGNLTRRFLIAGTGYGGSEALIASEIHADGGGKHRYYDIHGDARVLRDELGRDIVQEFDKLGRVTRIENVATGLNDWFTYDGNGRQLTHWNSVYGSENKETTDYDQAGRVIAQRAFGGDTTTTNYTWSSTIGTFGGWKTTTNHASGRQSMVDQDIFGRVTWRKDLNNTNYSYVYDVAGRLASISGGISQQITYFNTGKTRTVFSGQAEQANTNWSNKLVTYGYDAAGRLASEKLVNTKGTFTEGYWETYENPYSPGSYDWELWEQTFGGEGTYHPATYDVTSTVLQDSTGQYDALGRMIRYIDRDQSGVALVDKNWTYDAKGNVRSISATYSPMGSYGNLDSGTTAQNFWYRYDAMDRVVVSQGVLSGSTVVAGAQGIALSYDGLGRRATSQTGYQAAESYTYNGYDRLLTVVIGGVTRVQNSYDTLGRLDGQIERDGAWNLAFERHSFVYDSRGQLLSEKGRRKLADGKWHFTHTNNYFSATGTGSAPAYMTYSSQTGTSTGTVLFRSETKNWLSSNASYTPYYTTTGTTDSDSEDGLWADTYSNYSWDWNDPLGSLAPRQVNHALINRDGQSQASSNWLADGTLGSVNVQRVSGNARVHTVSYQTDVAGQVLRMNDTAGPAARYYYFGGRLMGEVGNNGTENVDHATRIARRDDDGTGGYRGGASSGSTYADFDANHRTLASGADAGGGGYTARGGETLVQVAAGLWGDGSLWYKLAEANGLGASSVLAAGQTLRVPGGIQSNRHAADTYKPYDPATALGDINPTTPQAPKARNCGVLGAIILAVVAIAVSYIASPVIGKLVGSLGMGALASEAATIAATAAVSNIANQGVEVASGIQEKFSWKSLGSSVLRSLVTGGSSGDFLTDFATGVASELQYQAIAKVTGLQDKFDWVGVVAAGVGKGVGGQVRGSFRDPQSRAAGAAQNLAIGAASAFASAATRSALEGSSFGRNIEAALPSVVAQAIVDGVGAIGSGIRQALADRGRMQAVESPTEGTVVTQGEIVAAAVLDPLAGYVPNDADIALAMATYGVGLPEAAIGPTGDQSYIDWVTQRRAMSAPEAGRRLSDPLESDPPSVRADKAMARQVEELVKSIATEAYTLENTPYGGKIQAAFDARVKEMYRAGPFTDEGLEAAADAAIGEDGSWGRDWSEFIPDLKNGGGVTLTKKTYRFNSEWQQLLGKFVSSEAGTGFLHYLDEATFNLVSLMDREGALSITRAENPNSALIGQGLGMIGLGTLGTIKTGAKKLAAESATPLMRGIAFENTAARAAQAEAFLPGQSVRRLSVRAFDDAGNLLPGRTVLDTAGYRSLDELGALEFKLDEGVSLTARQAEHFPYLARHGGIVVGNNGRDIGLLNRDPFGPLDVQRINGPTLPQTWWPQ